MVTTILYGVYCAVVAIIFTLIEYFTGMQYSTIYWFNWLAVPFYIIILVLAMRERKREDFGGTITYGQCVGTGFWVGVFSGIITAIFMYVYYTVINPDFINQMVAQQMQTMRDRGMTAQEIQNAQAMTRTMSSPAIMVLWSLFGAIIGSTIMALIIGIFVRSKNEEAVKAV